MQKMNEQQQLSHSEHLMASAPTASEALCLEYIIIIRFIIIVNYNSLILQYYITVYWMVRLKACTGSGFERGS